MTFAPVRLDARNPGPMTGSGNHTYLLHAADGAALLIDAGVAHPDHLDDLRAQLTARNAALGAVLVTHAHSDHMSGVEAIAAAWPGAQFFKHAWPDEDAKHRVEWRRLLDGDRVLFGDDALVVLHTPGHSPDHLVFWHEVSRTAFTGDLVIAGGRVMIQGSPNGDLAQYLASLERLLALGPERLLPAHGPVVDDPGRVIRGYIDHRLMREAQVLDAVSAGRDTITAIAGSIYHGLAPALMPAARETLRAHLEKLKSEGRAVHEDGRWRRYPA